MPFSARESLPREKIHRGAVGFPTVPVPIKISFFFFFYLLFRTVFRSTKYTPLCFDRAFAEVQTPLKDTRLVQSHTYVRSSMYVWRVARRYERYFPPPQLYRKKFQWYPLKRVRTTRARERAPTVILPGGDEDSAERCTGNDWSNIGNCN